ncbi:hypothetical protein QQF64_013978 [Cirrhinus molitorella]|uniref:Uncharacterized protein n=1 Tax=Cirrhinus molitorella TaxID=172907 RepID=A0ABR3LSP5_9TELE
MRILTVGGKYRSLTLHTNRTQSAGQAFPLNVVKVKGFTLSQTEGRKEAEGGRWRRKRASVCDYGANSNLLMSVRRAVHLLEISQMACATLFYLQPAGTASSQGTDCSFGTPLMPGTKEELSRGHLSASLCSPTCFPSIFLPTWSCMPLSTLQCLIISKTCKCIHIHGGTDAKLTVAGTHLTVPASQSASSRYGGRDVEGGGGQERVKTKRQEEEEEEEEEDGGKAGY